MIEESKLFCIVVPVYNRPDELRELMDSLEHQMLRNFEVIVVEDGSTHPSRAVCEQPWSFRVHYIAQANGGPASARNAGVRSSACQAKWVLFFDSDCILPPHYMGLCEELLADYVAVQCFGGPDAAGPDFSLWQKSVSYAMTSPFSTGGIRGGSERSGRFHPRTFNMGVLREAFLQVGGFADMRYGEDVDLSIRLQRAGYQTQLFSNLFVYHKRRTTYAAFFRQVMHSGRARWTLSCKHQRTLRLVHVLPAVGVLWLCAVGVASLWWGYALLGLLPAALYGLLVFAHAWYRLRHLRGGMLSVACCATMLLAYGVGFWIEMLGLDVERG